MILRKAPLFPNLTAALWICATLILVSIPHISRLPIWVPLVLVVLLIWRVLSVAKSYRLPPTWAQFAFALLVVAGIFLEYRTVFGRDAGVALIVALCGLKFMEMHSRRDALLLCFLGYFLIITNFLYSQTIPTALYMTLVMLVTTGTLITLSDKTDALNTRQRLRLSGVLLAQGLPVMLLLFVLFPRVTGPIWGLPKDANSGQVGLSDTIELGTISELSLSDELAFRVDFDGEIPPPSARYWRGPVLWYSNGKNWTAGFQRDLENTPIPLQTRGQRYDYTVTLEPNNKRWLLALDAPIQATSQISSRLHHDYQVLSARPIRSRVRYQLSSYTDYRMDVDLSAVNTVQQQRMQFYLRSALQLPDRAHPKTKALGQAWRAEFKDSEAIVNHALKYFNQEPFYYTFMPPLMLDDSVDQFLFEMRRGFCEHYAAAFAVLMRSAGVPTRIVTGYLGGRVNPINGMLVVRQRDAHAWNEVWLEGRGWVRVDPTGAVAPERVEQGIDSALSADFPDLFDTVQGGALGELLQQLQDRWDVLNNAWNQWVLGYDSARQASISQWLGFDRLGWRGLVITLTIGIVLVLAVLAAWMFTRRYGQPLDPVQQLYLRFCRKLARVGLAREPHEGPLDFAQRVSLARPELKNSIQRITDLYIRLRYREQTHDSLLPSLRLAVRRFHP